jgi:MFS transporter, YNFM family, putative membrane transport protein
MTIVIGYVPSPVGEAALEAGLAEAKAHGDDVVILNSPRRRSTVDGELIDGAAGDELVARAQQAGVTATIDHADHGDDLVETFQKVVGRTRLIHLSLGASVAVALTCALAPSWHVLVILRLLEGVTLAGLPAVATAYLREELHHSAQARAAGLYIGGTALGGMAGRLVTAPVADVLGWRWAMASAAVFALLCTAIVAISLPASRRFVARTVDRGALATLTRGALRDPALLALYALGACGVGSLVAVFNALGFRLTSSPFDLTVGSLSLVYLVYVLGTASSTVSGRLADRLGRRSILPAGCAIAMTGVLLTLLPSLPAIIAGLGALTVGFFIIHGLASGWVTARAHASGNSPGQAAAFYLFSYYVGSSVFGNLGSTAWTLAGWTGVVVLATGLLLVASILAATLRHIPALA